MLMTHVNLQNEKEAQLRLCLVSLFPCYWMRQTWDLCWRTKASNKSLHLYRFSNKNVSSFGSWTTLVMLTTFQQTQIIMTRFSTPVSGYIEDSQLTCFCNFSFNPLMIVMLTIWNYCKSVCFDPSSVVPSVFPLYRYLFCFSLIQFRGTKVVM